MKRFFFLKVLEKAYEKLKLDTLRHLKQNKEAGESRRIDKMCENLAKRAAGKRTDFNITTEFLKSSIQMGRSEFEEAIWNKMLLTK